MGSTKRVTEIFSTLVIMATLGCHQGGVIFIGHKVGESFSEFAAIEHPATEMPPGVTYTGVVHCFDTPDLGEK